MGKNNITKRKFKQHKTMAKVKSKVYGKRKAKTPYDMYKNI